ncbi:MAG: hypothetical protein IPO35_13390 [Uliginosibacterium sp.]|nr:hypothetical protein [Uliginosibacterium sp.]
MMDDLAPAAFASTIRTVYEFERKRPDIQIILIRANAGTVLPKFSAQQFDFIYVDGSPTTRKPGGHLPVQGAAQGWRHHVATISNSRPRSSCSPLLRPTTTKDFITLPDGRGFHPGVMRAVHEEMPGFTMREGFWWARLLGSTKPDC